MSPEHISATRTIQAAAEEIWQVVAAPQGHVDIDSSGMLMSVQSGPPQLTAVGEEFVLNMDREALGDMPLGRYQVSNIVTRIESCSMLAWSVGGVGMDPIGHVYSYQLTPADEGTEVTSTCDWSGVAEEIRAHVAFPIISATALRATLGILDRVVAARRSG